MPPTVTCFDGLALTIGAWGQSTITTDDLSYATDNAANYDQVQRAIRRIGDGTGFPTDTAGNPQTSLTFVCNDLGEVPIEVWALDLAGNLNTCTTVLQVVDNYAFCGDTAQVEIRVCFRHWCSGAPVLGPVLDLDYWPNIVQGNITLSVDTLGCLLIQGTLPALYNSFLVVPSMTTDPLNGVDLFDLVLINRHILGLSPLPTLGIIAADANNSRSVTTFDILTLRNLLTGMLTGFPGHSGATWRFVDAQHVFSGPNNPFLDFFSENQFLDTLQGMATFWAVKIGDVNCSAFPGIAPPAETRSTAYLHLPNRALLPGEIADVPVYFSEQEDWLGFQLGLAFDPAQVAVEAVLPGNLPNWDDHSAVQPRPGSLNILWYDTEAHPLGPDVPAFTLRLRALVPTTVQAALSVAHSGRAEAFARTETAHNLQLRFLDTATSGTHIGEAQPNPTAEGTGIALQLEQPGMVQLEVWDAQGRLLWQQHRQADAGMQQAVLPASAFPGNGLYLWRATVGLAVKTGRVLVQR